MIKTQVRAVPSQNRSRERVDLILRCTVDVICEVGVNGAKTSEIARRAGISLASLYRYFPNKSSIIGMLAEQYLEELHTFLYQFIEDFKLQEIDQLIEKSFSFYLEKRGFVEILKGMGSMPELAEIKKRDRELVALTMQQAAVARYGDVTAEEVYPACWLISEMMFYLCQQATNQGPEKRMELFKELKLMIRGFVLTRMSELSPAFARDLQTFSE
ncbi:TetR/AcrR family transcriptional regulator [Pelagibaculum spongiae]|uniref:TetR/AcrR family transcriptional regulator n=1 Tax=Pelagibaculum spongiae TaxID=2080658 RepID=A0A2V1GYA7_9GAMM|nr:TetR/AcrR family transcriptional regulator [Pelagibaculum spongiae]PVZ70633.1 TetR/AcrR family transcriptional regulator [Pelagibaculum spongiae]